MVAGLRHLRRAIIVIRTLARNDALFAIENVGMPKFFSAFVRAGLLAPRKTNMAQKRPGQRLKQALETYNTEIKRFKGCGFHLSQGRLHSSPTEDSLSKA